MTQIAMIAGPRNISTTMLRSFENRPDMLVFDEPFYACYLKASNAQHPMRDKILQSLPTRWLDVIVQLEEARRNISISDEKKYVFEKHIAFHFLPEMPTHWLNKRKLFLLIRDPRAMIASYYNKYNDVDPICKSLTFQRNLYEQYMKEEREIPILDSRDILSNPKEALEKLCGKLKIPFLKEMLDWPAGQRDSDGIWASHWYDAVIESTGFRPFQEKPVNLTPDLERLAQKCMPDYEYLHACRLR